MSQIGTISHTHIESYVRKCGIVPEILIPQTVEDIKATIEGKITDFPPMDELLKRLAQIKRFPNYQIYNHGIRMNYQDYVGVHQERMYQLVLLFQKELEALGVNVWLLLFLCRYHDSPEGVSIMWDIPTPIKEGFSEEEESIHALYERAIIKVLSHQILSPEEVDMSPEEIQACLDMCIDKSELIAQILSFLDKFDAMMVCFHEVMSWNKNFFVKKLNWYARFFKQVQKWERLPLVQDFCTQIPEWSLLNSIFNVDIGSLIDSSRQTYPPNKWHSQEDIHKSLQVPAYLLWKIATRNIPETLVWWEIFTGEEVLTKRRK